MVKLRHILAGEAGVTAVGGLSELVHECESVYYGVANGVYAYAEALPHHEGMVERAGEMALYGGIPLTLATAVGGAVSYMWNKTAGVTSGALTALLTLPLTYEPLLEAASGSGLVSYVNGEQLASSFHNGDFGVTAAVLTAVYLGTSAFFPDKKKEQSE